MRGKVLQLRRIELQGFKSFADPVELELAPGVTALVGPNGSGKSNVVEAIRWVLGEQSARRLRGYRMDDLIFGGSRRRRPVNLAEVTLTLEDEGGRLGLEQAEIEVTRRINRDGTGEFFINRMPCRMRDIQELFYNTGLGRAAYALVNQGELDLVITGRPEDRGAMVEEVAGLTGIREKANLTRRRLLRLEPARSRLADIMTEVGERLKPLAIQAERAERHEALSVELRGLERALQMHRLALLVEDAGSRQAEIGRMESDLSKQRQQLIEAREALSQHSSALQEAREQSARLRDEIIRGREHLVRETAELKALEERLKTQSLEIGRWGRQLGDTWKRWLNLRQQRRQGQQQQQLLQSNIAELSDQVRELDDQAARLRAQLELRDAGGHAGGLAERLRAAERRDSEAKTRLAIGQQQLESMTAAREHHLRARNQAESEVADCERELESARAQLAEGRACLKALDGRLGEADSRLVATREQQASADRKRAALAARLEALGDATAERGVDPGARYLLERYGDSPAEARHGLVGLLRELVSPLPGYELAFGAALESVASDIVARDPGVARRLLQELVESESGRATLRFSAGLSDQPGQLPEWEGLVCRGEQMLDPGSPAIEAARVLMADLVVMENLDLVPADDVLLRHRIRAVTMDGYLAFPGGIRGGVVTEGNGSRAEVLRLETEIGQLDEKVRQAAQDEAEVAQRQGQLRTEREGLMGAIRALEMKQELLTGSAAACRARVAESREQLAALDVDLGQLGEQLEQDEVQAEQAGQERAALESELKAAQGGQESQAEPGKSAEHALAEVVQQTTRARAQLESSRGRLQVHGAWSQDLSADMMELAADRKEVITELASAERELVSSSDKLDGLRDRVRAAEQAIADVEARACTQEELIGDGERKVSELENSIRTGEARFSRIEGKLSGQEMVMARVAAELESARQLLRERGLTDAEMQGAEVLQEADAVAGRVARLREEITAMGVVNPLAIEEHAVLRERQRLQQAALEDIDAAAGDVEWIKAWLERTMKRVFMRTLEQINDGFKVAFGRLFGGGDAMILVEDGTAEDQVAGIGIRAQPPGKKLQHLSLLSGGERALTGAAFLFALLDHLPPPFVVFDEIDAALDEHNIRRFGEYLADLGARVQVVVVTHQRATMEIADMLYGTTMDETGVTQLVPVKMSEVEAAGT